MEEEFYDEDCDYFESTIVDLKEQLKKEVKQEFKDKMKELEKENKKLQEVKENWEKIKQEYKQKEIKLKYEVEEEKRNARYLPIKKLFENFQIEYYQVYSHYEKNEKCDKCDEDRKLTIIDCYGRKHKVDCPCNDKKHIEYSISTKYVIGISSISNRNGELKVWFYLDYRPDRREEDCYYSSGTFINDKIIKKFDEMTQEQKDKEYQDWYFTTKEEAQKYAEYLRSKED